VPKQNKTIQFFHGGINSNADPRDLRNEESPSLIDISIDKVGRLTCLGGTEVSETPVSNFTGKTVEDEQGLFVMNSDRDLLGAASNEDIVFLYNDTATAIDAMDSNLDYHLGIIETGSIKPIFYSVDGNLRVADSSCVYDPKWFGFITEEKLDYTNAHGGSIGWYPTDQEITKPAYGQPSILISTPYPGTDDFSGDQSHGENSADSEVTGGLVAGGYGFSNNFLESGNVGLRVGLQYNTPLETDPSSWSNTSLTGISSPAVTSTWTSSPFENKVVHCNSSGNGSQSVFNDDSGPTFVIDESQSFVFGLSMGTSEIDKLDRVVVYLYAQTTADVLEFSFPANELIYGGVGNWSFISCCVDNISTADAAHGSTFDHWKIQLVQKSGNGGNATPDFYTTIPVIAKSTEAGYQKGVYSFSATWLYDTAKQESLPTACFSGAAYSKSEFAIIGSPLLFNYDIYVYPWSDRMWTTGNGVELATSTINSTGHTLVNGDAIKLEGLNNITTPVDDTLYYVIGATTNDFQISTTLGGSAVTFAGAADDDVVSSTAQVTSGSNMITLDALDGNADDYYNGQIIKLTGGTGGYQARKVDDYTSSSKELLTRMDWQANPDNTTTYDIGVTYQRYELNKRITGARIYWKLNSLDDNYLIGELDFINNGFKWFPDGETISYDFENTSSTEPPVLNNTVIAKGILPASANFIDTYKNINGFSANAEFINSRYKAVCVHGRRAYIGNIKRPTGPSQPDTMVKSVVNKFDVFPENSGEVDVVVRDGESIIELETYADRILQFKEKTMYIINVSENVEYLEDTYRNKGILKWWHATKTDMGIAWFNMFGVYFYDGKGVTNLLEKDGMRLLDASTWETFISTSPAEAQIGYIPKKRQLLIKNNSEHVYIFDFVLRAWMYGDTAINKTTKMTNFALKDEELIYITDPAATSKIWKWNPSPLAPAFHYQGRDDDFGSPGIRKKIYKVYISYTSGAGALPTVTYGVNGEDPTNAVSTGSFSINQPKWTQATFTFASDTNSCYSFQLQIDGTIANPADFEINDITIIHRIKSIK
jgi:hypothetical protein